MPKLADHHAASVVKILYLGDSGVGKTGSLVSLVKAGYKMHILDMDNGLDILLAFVKKDCPDLINNVDYESYRDGYKATAIGPTVDGVPRAYVNSLKAMTEWPVDKTKPSEWGPDHIFVIDSFTGLSKAAFEWAKGMNPSAKDPRQWFHQAQQALENILSLLTSPAFKSNVIITAHVVLQDGPDGSTRGYANSIGKALGPIIPTYFNTMLLAKSQGIGKSVKRTIETAPTTLLDLKNPVPFKIEQTYPLETGLSTIFATLKETQQ